MSSATAHRQRTISPNECLQCFPFDQLHRVITTVALRGGAELEDARHVAVPQSRRRAGFAKEALARRLRPAILRWHVDDLEGHCTVQHFVARPISHSHRATSQLPIRAVFRQLDFEIPED